MCKREVSKISAAAMCFCFFAHAATAQNIAADSPFHSRLTLQAGGANNPLTVHRDALNRPCLDVEAASRAQVINPNIYDHIVSVYNRCLTTIRLQVCYYGTDHCIDMEVPSNKRKDGVLGIMPTMQYFRYVYREKPK